MTTAADYEPELVDALNLLIEDERASVEMEVALASGATEYAERESLARMGADDIHSCETLRTEMERAGLPVTPQINGVVFEVLGAERYDDRLRAFAHHQRIVADRASDLLESNLEGELRAALINIQSTHQGHIEWASHRADMFAATRLMEFGPRQSGHVMDTTATPAGATDPAEAISSVDAPLPDIPAEEATTDAPNESLEEAFEAETPIPTIAETFMEEVEEAPAALDEAITSGEIAPVAEAAEPETLAEPQAPRPRRGRPRKAAPPAE